MKVLGVTPELEEAARQRALALLERLDAPHDY